ncbi:MAG: flagellar biosynthetic protein FliO [Sedimentisphaerales bacterium]|nr:flagellar biosynthetic protein FliO [Sedimentisphaerales bacterium]
MIRSKKRVFILCLALLIGGGWISIAARSADQKAQPVTTDRNTSFLTDPNLASRMDASFNGRGLFARMMLCILLVAGLGVGMVYMSKKVLPKVTNAPGKEIRVRETAYLGPRKALHLVEIGHHKLLIGSTNDSVTALADLTDTWLEAAKQESSDDAVRL